MSDEMKLTEIFRPEPAMLEDIHLLRETRERIRLSNAQLSEIRERLSVIPDGVVVRHELLDGTFYRKRRKITPRISDLNAVPEHFLKAMLVQNLVNEYFRQTGEIPPGIEIGFGRGDLCCGPSGESAAA